MAARMDSRCSAKHLAYHVFTCSAWGLQDMRNSECSIEGAAQDLERQLWVDVMMELTHERGAHVN